ncbi:hypothetical protein AA105894_2567 [Asaia spathodeae NBRC 105894]|nr:hypothetical protein AA105894_2567 [Asaia spathodeae NBRC 105894]
MDNVEPDILRRAGKLPRDRHGYDVGTVRINNSEDLKIRRHGPLGEEPWGIMRLDPNTKDYVFESLHEETASSSGIRGDEGYVSGKVVKDAGGTLPYWDPNL